MIYYHCKRRRRFVAEKYIYLFLLSPPLSGSGKDHIVQRDDIIAIINYPRNMSNDDINNIVSNTYAYEMRTTRQIDLSSRGGAHRYRARRRPM